MTDHHHDHHEHDADPAMPHISEPANAVAAKAGQSMAARREQDNTAANMTPMQMAYQLISNGADLGSVKEMLALSKELAADQAKRAFDAAIASAKAEIGPAQRNKRGHSGKYADFAAYAAVVDPVIHRYGLSYRFRTEQTDGIKVTCVLSHKEGHSEENSLKGPADSSGSKNAIQAVGSTLTYLQRYTLVQALGLAATDDDDGQAHGKTTREVETISEDQQMAIRDLLSATGFDEQRFLKMGGLAKLSDMTVKQYPEAFAMLKKKEADRAA